MGILRNVVLGGVAYGLITPSCLAFDGENFALHGYGDQGYMLTNRNSYLSADNKGSFNYTDISLVLSASLSETTTLWTQLSTLDTEENTIGLDWAFIEEKVNKAMTLRAGQIRFPMGFYNENKRAKILQLSTLEPQMYQDLRGEEVIPETFRGISMVLSPDISVGDISVELFGGQRFSQDADRLYHNTYGATVTYLPPVDGVRVMGTTFASINKKDVADNPPISGRQYGWLMGAEYVDNGWDVKTEYGDSRDPDLNIVTYYVQTGYTFFDKLTPFARYDYITTNDAYRSNPSYYQKDSVAGLSYRVNSNVAVKIEDHILQGYAMPAKRGFRNDTKPGEGAPNWNLFMASVDFMF